MSTTFLENLKIVVDKPPPKCYSMRVDQQSTFTPTKEEIYYGY